MESQILPGIAAYETLQTVMPKAEALQTDKKVWRIDMLKCPYHDACVHYSCPELCPCFCDSDDVTYGGMHPKLIWRRTKTLGHGNDRCDFCIKLTED